jgi:ABC-type nitrate/sulfonate/bicarbonate transport system permease component
MWMGFQNGEKLVASVLSAFAPVVMRAVTGAAMGRSQLTPR